MGDENYHSYIYILIDLANEIWAQVDRDTVFIGVVVMKHEVCDCIMSSFNSIDNLGFGMDLELP